MPSAAMTPQEFWSLVEQTRNSSSEVQANALSEKLAALGLEGVVAFENHLNHHISELMSFDHLAANFIIQSYTSDDVFTDFQAWLVMQGKERFENARDDVETIAKWLEPEDVEAIDGGVFVTLSVEVYRSLGGDEDEFYDRIRHPDEVEFEIEWPETRAGFEERLPVLYRKFWNQERVRELHAD